MKKLLIGLFFLTSTLSSAVYAHSTSYNYHFDFIAYYNIEGDKLGGDYATISLHYVMKSGEEVVEEKISPPTKDSNLTQMEIVGENKVRFIMKSVDIDTMVPANIEKSGDQLASLTIASEDVLAVVGEDLAAFLRESPEISVDLAATDMVCTKMLEQLSCKGSIDVTMIEN